VSFDLCRRRRCAPLQPALGDAIAERLDRLAGGVGGPMDEWHCRTAEATAELGAMAGLHVGMRVLDIGCGVGGAARRLAADHAVSVTGIDRNRMCVEVAHFLTRPNSRRVRVRFDCGRAESAPFATESFDCIWLQHVLLNIHDKARLFGEVHRMLVAGGVLAIHEIVSPRGGPIPFPLPWAPSASRCFVPAPERLRIALESAGFVLTHWNDTTPLARQWCGRVLAEAGARAAGDPMIVPGGVAAMRNLAGALAARTLGVAMAVFHKRE
jgi:SAM-dependent methyltransferase